jgi:hypothetical protein
MTHEPLILVVNLTKMNFVFYFGLLCTAKSRHVINE